VAIKVPRAGLLRSAEQVESFLAEARIAAGLRHRAIVAVYDAGRAEDHGVFVVFEYVSGRSLAQVLEGDQLAPAQIARLLIPIAEAAHYAHSMALVHRDLKPSNILIDENGKAHIADFGLAVHEDLQDIRTGEIAGTPHYMAPEQVRGETHRLDGRTDIWALGVILYRALVGRLPFAGRGHTEIFDEVLHRDPKPPRQISDAIPRELERITLKCLAKRMADRFETAADLADDLKRWLVAEQSTDVFATPPKLEAIPSASSAAKIIPKGLRAFDIDDADFFPTLIPGPRDRDGLPEVIRAWKRRIEERDAARAFTVGLLYGPSGSGKSSLVKAGLLPRLARTVRAIYVEATPSGTEAALRTGLSRNVPGLVGYERLEEMTAAIRERAATRPGSKVLLVIDQFEQWLENHPAETDNELTRALLQCDGVGLQALLLVRDDYWMAVTRFLRALEVRLVEGVNSAPVELFDLEHAGRVVCELGRALGRLPDLVTAPTPDQKRFVDTAVKELAGDDGRVIPVRLTLFAEMLKHREWSTRTLRELGGMEGIGVMFLEETFSAPTAPPVHRYHQRAAQAVLRALLPEAGSDLKGQWRPMSLLCKASGYAERPKEFAELISVLDGELRMVTPVDRAANAELAGESAPTPDETCYQLTHDYLVPPLRQWLTRKQRETLNGRALLQLASATAWWRDRPEARRLPSVLEWATILCCTRRRSWSVDERRLMKAATGRVLWRTAAALALVAAIGFAAFWVRQRDRARALLQTALHSDYERLPTLIRDLAGFRELVRADLERLESNPSTSPADSEVAALALYDVEPTPRRASFLLDRLKKAQPDEVKVVRDTLAAHPEHVGTDALRKLYLDESAEPGARLRVACVLAAAETSAGSGLAEALLAEPRRAVPQWVELLGTAVHLLITPLGDLCRDSGREATVRSTAAEALAEVLERRHEPVKLAQFMVDSLPDSSRVLLQELVARERPARVTASLRAVLSEVVDDPYNEVAKDALAGRQAAAAIALLALGEPDLLWPLLRHRPDPRLRSILIDRLAADTLSTPSLVARFARENLDATELQAILLAWAEKRQAAVSPSVQATVIARARALYLGDPDPGVHSGAELLLTRWASPEVVSQCANELRRHAKNRRGSRWTLGPNGHTFAILDGPLEFRMGAQPHESAHYGDPSLHSRRIGRSIMVSTKEVTVEQYQAFKPSHRNDPRYGDEPDAAAIHVSWYMAVAYCNWLSAQAGIDKSEYCYAETPDLKIELGECAVKRTGYRLPTEAEWEYLCRAGTETARPYGDSDDLLVRYAWTWLNSGNRVRQPGRLLPNQFGLFDILGNAWEWCQDGPAGYYTASATQFPPYPAGTHEKPAADPVRDEVVEFIDRAHETWRILRGGAFSYAPNRARSAYRDWQPSSDVREYLGIRVVRTLPPIEAGEQAAQMRRTEVKSLRARD
jgi:eukaryotic-like serine/threonine-protein kinase